MMRIAKDAHVDSIIEEIQRVLRVCARQRLDDEQRATFDFCLVRCLVIVINTCFKEG